MSSIFIVLFYSVSCVVMGYMFMFPFMRNFDENWELSLPTLIASAFIVGQGILGTAWMMMGLGGVFRLTYILILLIFITTCGLVIYRNSIVSHGRRLFSSWKQLKHIPILWTPALLMVLTASLLFGVKSITNLRLWEDGEAFYFMLPKVMAASERLVPARNIYHSFTQIGLSGEMHYSALMSISGELAAKFFVAMTAAASLQFVLNVCSNLGVKFVGKLFAAAMLLTSTGFTLWLYGGKTEIFSVTFALGAFCWAIGTFRKPNALSMMMIGLYSGFAISSKLSYIPSLLPAIFIILLSTVLIYERENQSNLKIISINVVKLFFIFSSFFIVPLFFNSIKNVYLFNEPLAPFITFNSSQPKIFTQIWYNEQDTKYILLTYPFALVFGKYPLMGGNVSPLVLIGLGFAGLITYKRKIVKYRALTIAGSASAGLLAWIVIAPSVLCPRYILPVLVMLFPIAALAFDHLFCKNDARWIYVPIKVVVITILFLSLYVTTEELWRGTTADIDQITGKTPNAGRQGAFVPGQLFINSHANYGDRVFVNGYLSYYLRPDLLQCMNDASDARISQNKADLYKLGYRYILIQKNAALNSDLILAFANEDNSDVEAKNIHSDQESIVYELVGKNPEIKPKKICVQKNRVAWDVENISFPQL